MLLHPIMLEAMAKSITEQREREARLMHAVHADPAPHQGTVRLWLARTLVRAAVRLDARARDIPRRGTADYAR